MQLHHFNKTALKIVTSFLAALVMFAVLAGQSANATSVEEPTSMLQEYSKTISLINHLEQNLLDAQVQIREIHKGFEVGTYTTEEVFIATIILFDIEHAVIDAKQKLALTIAKIKVQDPNFEQYDMKLASQNF